MAIELKTLEVCPKCLTRKEDITLDTIYECECGEEFSKEQEGTHKCPQCGHFASKKTEEGCPECCAEIEEKEVYECSYCNKLYEDAEGAWKCCSEAAGEPEPPEVIKERNDRETARLAKIRATEESLARSIIEHPPAHNIGDIIKDIDLSARGSFNRQAFVDAEIIKLIPDQSTFGIPRQTEWYGWKYILARLPDKDRTECLKENDIEYQTGRADPSREYRWCCPFVIVHIGESCNKCGKPFEEISTEKRG